MDKTCWLCGDLSACWYGKVGVEGGWFIEGRECPHVPDARANAWSGADTRRQLGSSPRRASYLRSSPRAWARSCARGPANVSVGSPTQTWNSGLTCEIAG